MDAESRSKSLIAPHEVYHGTKSFLTFLNAFLLIYNDKRENLDARLSKIKYVNKFEIHNYLTAAKKLILFSHQCSQCLLVVMAASFKF